MSIDWIKYDGTNPPDTDSVILAIVLLGNEPELALLKWSTEEKRWIFKEYPFFFHCKVLYYTTLWVPADIPVSVFMAGFEV